MRIPDTIRSIWLDLFGKKLDRCLVEGDKMIQYWNDIYSNKPEWQTYTTRGLFGERKQWRYLLNAGKMLCAELSRLVFSEEPTLDIDPDVLDFLTHQRFWANLRPWLERSLGLGNGALKWVVKDGELFIDYVGATNFMPVTYSSAGVAEADFASSLTKNGKEFKIVEQHRKNSAGLGYEITLKAFKKNDSGEYKECLASEAGIDPEPVLVATEKPLFVIWKNPEANNLEPDSPLGVSIYANSVDTLRQIDEAFDNLSHERNSTRRKIIIGQSMIKTVCETAKQKRDIYYDKHDSVYVAFDDAEKQNMMPVDINFPFRITEITSDINLNLALFCKQSGMSDNFLSFDGSSMKTATEVVSENSKTFRTKKDIENSLTPVILEFLSVLKEIGVDYQISTTDKEYGITWDDAVIEDRASKENRIIARYGAKLITLEDALIQLDGLTAEEAVEKAKAIREMSATVDANTLFGGSDGQ